VDHIDNSPVQIEIRRRQNTLRVAGVGTALFSIWGAVKLLALFIVFSDESVRAVRSMSDAAIELSDRGVFRVALAAAIIGALISVAVRSYVGRAAVAESKGKKRSWFYLVVAAFLAFLDFTAFASGLLTFGAPQQPGAFSGDVTITSLIIDLTSAVIITEMIIAAVRIRSLTKKKSEG